MYWGIQNTSSSSAGFPMLCWEKLFQLFLPVTRKEGSGGWERWESNWMSSTVDDPSFLPIQFSEFSVWCNRFRNVVCNVVLFFLVSRVLSQRAADNGGFPRVRNTHHPHDMFLAFDIIVWNSLSPYLCNRGV